MFDSINVWARKSGAASKVRSKLPCINLSVSISGSSKFYPAEIEILFPQLRARPNVELFMSGTKLRELSS